MLLRELAQEAHVILEKHLQIRPVFQHREAIDADSECETRHPLGVVVHKSIHRRIHHSRAE